MSELSTKPKQSLLSSGSSRDYSGYLILAGNALTIVMALWQNWDLGPLLLIYWAQSVTIGVFHFFRMMKLRHFSTDGFTSNNKPVPETEKGKRSTAWFFAMHYGFFHFGYAVFLFVGILGASDEMAGDPASSFGLLWIVLCVIGFFFSHALSFKNNVEEDLKYRPNLGTMMFLPYVRIVPMHLTIIFGGMLASGSGRWVLLLFLVLKTGADYLFHIIEHRALRKKKNLIETPR